MHVGVADYLAIALVFTATVGRQAAHDGASGVLRWLLEFEKEGEGLFDRRHVRIVQCPDEPFKFMVLDGLKTLHVHITFVMEEGWLAYGDFIVALSVRCCDRCTDGQGSGCIIIFSGYDQHGARFRSDSEVDQINLPRTSRHTRYPGRPASWPWAAGYQHCLA